MLHVRRQAYAAFFTGTLLIYSIVFALTRLPGTEMHAHVIGVAALSDLTLTVSILYYYFIIRPGFSSWAAVIPIVLAGLRSASFVLPATEQQWMPSLAWFAAPLEVFVFVAIIRRLRLPATPHRDPVNAIEETCRQLFPNRLVAAAVATEIMVFYFALLSWRLSPRRDTGFSSLEASGYGMLTTLLLCAICFESIPAHLLLQQWSSAAAWIWTAVDIVSLIWVIGLRRSIQLLPSTIDGNRVLIRAGLLWRIQLDGSNVKAVGRLSATAGDLPAGCLRLTALNDPQLLIDLHEPVEAHGPLGRVRVVRQIALAVDDDVVFLRALKEACAC